jgi:group I intron endonuclease
LPKRVAPLTKPPLGLGNISWRRVMNGILYRIINMKNGKCYVGKTYAGFYIRLSRHISDSKREDRPLYRAIRKYGLNSFSAEILGEYPSNLLESKEIEYIKYYDSFNNGYNATLGGEGHKLLDIDEKAVIKSYSTIGNIAEVARQYNISHEIARQILLRNSIKINKTKLVESISKEVYSPTLDKHFISVTSAANYLVEEGISTSLSGAKSTIAKVCRGAKLTYKGHTFSYVAKEDKKYRVKSSTLDISFNTSELIAKYLIDQGISNSNVKATTIGVQKVCTGYLKSYKNHKFEYY